MRCVVDAQLPKHFCAWLDLAGHDAMHTSDLPLGNRTPDGDIVDLAERDGRVVVTKDDDFVQSFLVAGRPSRPLLVTTGNISNAELEKLMQANLAAIVTALEEYRFVELGQETFAIHE